MTGIEDLEPAEDPYKDCRDAVAYCEQVLDPLGYFVARREKGRNAEQTGYSILEQVEIDYFEASNVGDTAVMTKKWGLARQIKRPSFLHYVRAKLGEL
jgi:hypothetical protein